MKSGHWAEHPGAAVSCGEMIFAVVRKRPTGEGRVATDVRSLWTHGGVRRRAAGMRAQGESSCAFGEYMTTCAGRNTRASVARGRRRAIGCVIADVWRAIIYLGQRCVSTCER